MTIEEIKNVNVNSEGVATTRYTPDGLTPIGVHSYTATYKQNDHYNESTSASREFAVSKATTTTISNAIGNTGEQINLIADVTGSNFTVDSGVVQFKVAGQIKGTANVSNGRAIFEYTIDCQDESTLQAVYVGVKGLYGTSTSNTAKIDVRHATNLFVQNTIMNPGDQINITGTATYTDDSNTTTNIANATGEFYFDGVKYSDITITNGSFTLSGSLPFNSAYGVHNCKVTLTETDNYEATEYSFTIYIRHPTTTESVDISGSKGETIILSATVVDELNQNVAEGTVYFEVTGTGLTTYSATGNVVNGVAQVEYEIPSSTNLERIYFNAQFQQSTNYMTSDSESTGTITIRKDVLVTIQDVETIVGEEKVITAVITCGGNAVTEGTVDFEIVEDNS